MRNDRKLFIKLINDEIFLEQGRLFFSLLYAFSSANYQIRVFNNIPQEKTGDIGRLAFSLNNIVIDKSYPDDPSQWIYLYDKEDKPISKMGWKKKIEVKTNIFSPYWFRKTFILPFSFHPVHWKHHQDNLGRKVKDLRTSKRGMRILFSGDTKGYTNSHIKYPTKKLTRTDIVSTALEKLDPNEVSPITNATQLELSSEEYKNQCIIVDSNKTWIDDKKWLDILSRADFFLSPPGIVMPMCHNIIEAMAVGTIPITNYPEWFHPNLTHTKNCISFTDKSDLLNKLKMTMHMDEKQIVTLREGVIDYYETYLRQDRFIHRLELIRKNKLTLLLYSERNTAKNASKLGRNSILIRGTDLS